MESARSLAPRADIAARPAPAQEAPPAPAQEAPPAPAAHLLDRLLRDPRSLAEDIRAGSLSRSAQSGVVAIAAGGAAIYGLSIGIQAGGAQALVGALKLPVAMLVAAGLSLPVLHLSCGLSGVRLPFDRLSGLVMQALATSTVTMAGLAPLVVVAWLTVSAAACGECAGPSEWYVYRRVVLAGLGVAMVGGLAGATRLLRVLPMRAVLPWVGVFGLAGLQLVWLLRPVVGSPGDELVLLRPLESNALYEALRALWAVL